MTKSIPFGRPILGEEEKAAVCEVLSGHVLTHGPKCAAFEERFADLVGSKHAVTTSNCTTALQLSLMAAGIGPGNTVIVPAMTHVATAHSVEHVGARPVFADVDPETGNIDPRAVEAAITPETRAITVVHYLGLPCDMDAICEIADKHGLALIEDCATAVGAEYDGKAPGTFGMTGCFSFYPAKHMTTMEGGMLTTNSDDVAARVRKLRAFGYDKGLGERTEPGVYDIVALGHNFRMSEAQAAIGLCQLDRLDDFMAKRRSNSDRLVEMLSDLDRVRVFPMEHGKARSGRYCVNFTIMPDAGIERSSLVAEINDAGIGTSVHYPVALPLSTYYKDRYGYADDAYPVAHWIASNTVSLPCGPHLSDDDAAYIGETVSRLLS